jgi:tetratricopeptide (TPR) repeat protein
MHLFLFSHLKEKQLMKQILLILVISVFSLTTFSQKKAEKQFNQAVELYYDKEYDSALFLFATVYNNGWINKTLAAKAYYNMGDIYMIKKNIKKAKEIFRSILDSDFDEMDRGGRGSGLMAEPYALYKNNSCNILAEIALDEKDYKNALRYTQMADTEYPYVHFCGNEYEANDIHMAVMYAKCYSGLGDSDRAIQTLMPHCIENGFANNSRLIEQLCEMLKKKYSREEIKQEINNAISGIYLKEIKRRDYVNSNYYTKMFNTELELGTYSRENDYLKTKGLKGVELYKYYFKEGYFIKKLLE